MATRPTRRCRPPQRPWLVTLSALLLLSQIACRCPGEQRGGLSLDGVDRSDGRLPQLEAPRLPGSAIEVDGRLDEPAWRRAGSTGPFVDPRTGKPDPGSPVNAVARVAWDSQRLLFGFVVHDAAPASPFSRDQVDPHIWERASAVELMIQPGDPGDNRHYYEVQVDVAGAVWDTRFDDYNHPITGPPGQRRFGHQQWRSHVERAVAIDRRSGHYSVELAIPWLAFVPPASPAGRTQVPPRPGDVWRINLYSFRDGQRAALAWSPLLGQGNFHRASRFGRVRFAAAARAADGRSTATEGR